jgi:hypothetical protein
VPPSRIPRRAPIHLPCRGRGGMHLRLGGLGMGISVCAPIHLARQQEGQACAATPVPGFMLTRCYRCPADPSHSSLLGRPLPPATPCFKCFRCFVLMF